MNDMVDEIKINVYYSVLFTLLNISVEDWSTILNDYLI